MDLMATAGQAGQAATAGQASGGEGQLALSRSRASWALAELAAPPPAAGEVEARRAALAARRADAERFHFRDLWTKNPHGGPYRKVVPKGTAAIDASGPGYGPGCSAIGISSGSARHTQLAVAAAGGGGGGGYRGGYSGPGYEVVRVGPTTNFVGDAMSTGAVDLVLAELEELQAPPPLPLALPPASSAPSAFLLLPPPLHQPVTAADLVPLGGAAGGTLAGVPGAAPLADAWAPLAARRGRNGEPSAAELVELRRAARRLLGRG